VSIDTLKHVETSVDMVMYAEDKFQPYELLRASLAPAWLNGGEVAAKHNPRKETWLFITRIIQFCLSTALSLVLTRKNRSVHGTEIDAGSETVDHHMTCIPAKFQ